MKNTGNYILSDYKYIFYNKETKMVQNIIVVPLLNVIFQKLLYYSQEEVKVLGIKKN